MVDFMFDAPSNEKGSKTLNIDLDYASEKLKNARISQLQVA
jgi:hypothetical protein